jgi:phage baseplate assembly protein gpV
MTKNVQEQLNAHTDELNQLKGIISIAKVSTVSTAQRTARLILENGIVSEPLKVLRRGDNWMPSVGEQVVCLTRKGGSGFIVGGL